MNKHNDKQLPRYYPPLTENHTKKLFQATEMFGLVIADVSFKAFQKVIVRYKFENIGKSIIPTIHLTVLFLNKTIVANRLSFKYRCNSYMQRISKNLYLNCKTVVIIHGYLRVLFA